jgi:dolichol-phosphate mannosyltransferase
LHSQAATNTSITSGSKEGASIDLSIIIPCFNEEEGIPHLWDRLNPVLDDLKNTMNVEMVFVDDGSTDNTNRLLEDYCKGKENFRLITHKVNKGIGAALRTGFQNAKGEIIVTTDSDCTYSPTEIPRIIECLTDEYDIVTASPYHPEGGAENVPRYRLFLSKGVTWLYSMRVGSNIHTYTSMFRAYRRKTIEEIEFEADDFIVTVEFLVRSLKRGYKIHEMPATLHSRIYGVSKMKTLKVFWRHLKFILSLDRYE